MKKKIILFITLISIMICLIGCSYSDRGGTRITHVSGVDEWVSPDGVHYWVDGYRMAPRYNNNGNLVIDEIE